MKKVTKKLETRLKNIQDGYYNAFSEAKKLVNELLLRNGGEVKIPNKLHNDEMCVNVYTKHGIDEYFFAGATIINNDISLICVNEDSGKVEIVNPGYYDRIELIDVAKYLILYLNDELEVNEEYEED